MTASKLCRVIVLRQGHETYRTRRGVDMTGGEVVDLAQLAPLVGALRSALTAEFPPHL